MLLVKGAGGGCHVTSICQVVLLASLAGWAKAAALASVVAAALPPQPTAGGGDSGGGVPAVYVCSHLPTLNGRYEARPADLWHQCIGDMNSSKPVYEQVGDGYSHYLWYNPVEGVWAHSMLPCSPHPIFWSSGDADSPDQVARGTWRTDDPRSQLWEALQVADMQGCPPAVVRLCVLGAGEDLPYAGQYVLDRELDDCGQPSVARYSHGVSGRFFLWHDNSTTVPRWVVSSAMCDSSNISLWARSVLPHLATSPDLVPPGAWTGGDIDVRVITHNVCPTLVQHPGLAVACKASTVSIVVLDARQVQAHNMYVGEEGDRDSKTGLNKDCLPTYTENTITFQFQMHQCKPVVTVDGPYVLFTFTLHSEVVAPSAVITRKVQAETMTATCRYPKETTVSSKFVVGMSLVEYLGTDVGAPFDFSMDLYQDQDMAFAIGKDAHVRMGDTIYVRVSLDTLAPIKIGVQTCTARPTADPSVQWHLIQNYCYGGGDCDDTVILTLASDTVYMFSVAAFRFVAYPHSPIYIQCIMHVCPQADEGPTCQHPVKEEPDKLCGPHSGPHADPLAGDPATNRHTESRARVVQGKDGKSTEKLASRIRGKTSGANDW